MSNASIQTILVMPKNDRYHYYVVNNENKRSMKTIDLRYFILEYADINRTKLAELLKTFRTFLVIVKDNKIQELEFDLKGNYEQLKSQNKIIDKKTIEKEKTNKIKNDKVDRMLDIAKKQFDKVWEK